MAFTHLTYNDRINIEKLYNKRKSVSEIAAFLDRPRQTIYNELKRGFYTTRDYEYRDIKRYSAYKAQKDYEYRLTAHGAPLKIGKDYDVAYKIEELICTKKYSPYHAVIATGKPFCVSTLYSYIEKGVFLHLTNKQLPEKGLRKKRSYHKVQKAPIYGTSIERRPKVVDDRKQFGHWEMDCVCGALNGYSQSLLVLTERKSRAELIYKIQKRNLDNVAIVLDNLSKKSDFEHVFTTITMDNGNEFKDPDRLKQNKKVQLFYCHPYSSYERGSNENANRIIRRHFPKGTTFDNVDSTEIIEAVNWQNKMHRKIFNGMTAEEVFNKYSSVPLENFYDLSK